MIMPNYTLTRKQTTYSTRTTEGVIAEFFLLVLQEFPLVLTRFDKSAELRKLVYVSPFPLSLTADSLPSIMRQT